MKFRIEFCVRDGESDPNHWVKVAESNERILIDDHWKLCIQQTIDAVRKWNKRHTRIFRMTEDGKEIMRMDLTSQLFTAKLPPPGLPGPRVA